MSTNKIDEIRHYLKLSRESNSEDAGLSEWVRKFIHKHSPFQIRYVCIDVMQTDIQEIIETSLKCKNRGLNHWYEVVVDDINPIITGGFTDSFRVINDDRYQRIRAMVEDCCQEFDDITLEDNWVQ